MPIGAVVKLCDSGQIQVVDDEANVSAEGFVMWSRVRVSSCGVLLPSPAGALDLPSECH